MIQNSIDIRFVSHTDYDQWLPLWEQYLTFYNTALSLAGVEKTL